MPALTNHTGLIVAGVIVLLGLVVYGFRDLIRFSFTRVWAISGVCFDESIRRRVLWITPLAIVGIILVSQLTRPIDEQDAIRQTTKFCLFATGLVVTLTAIILACTNLPKEIESRVIFTIVTKPTTRLEIVLGKVLGFARVSAAILLIMGAFSYAYLALRAWSLGQDVRDRLPTADAVSKPTLEHYASAGLLNAREFLEPRDVQFYAEVPGRADDVRWFSAAAEQTAYVPYVLDPATFPLPRTEEEAAALGLPPLAIMVVADFRRPQGETAAESADAATTTAPTAASRVQVPFLPGMEPNAPAGEEPSLVFDVVDKDFYSLANFQQLINGGRPVKLTATNEPVIVPVGPALLPQLAKLAPPGEPVRFYLKITGGRSGYHYGLGDDAVYLGVRPAPDQFVPIPPAPDAMAGGRRAETLFRGRPGRAAPQLRGDVGDAVPVAVFRFRDVTPPTGDQTTVEFRTRIERSSDDEAEADRPTQVELRVLNRDSQELSAPVTIYPENDRPTFASLPTAAMAGGNFDILVRVPTAGAWIGLAPRNLGLVQADRSFALNLGKSLLVLWLLSVLVIAIAIFCSTFLSWPIAIVLTVVILLGHWGVQQIGDAATPGIGRQVATDLGIRDAADARVVSQGVEVLTTMLGMLSRVLPDISRFSATEYIERGVWMPTENVLGALAVLGGFGVPLVVLAYVFLRNKEVAP